MNEENKTEETLSPQELEDSGRNPDGTFKDGHKKIEGSGRPKNTLKDYVRRILSEMTDEEKEKWLEENKIAGIDQWRMAEGNPENNTDITTKGEKIEIKQIIYGNPDTLQIPAENIPTADTPSDTKSEV